MIKYNAAGDVNQINQVISGVNTHHYFSTGDLVSRLGGGHIGGNIYEWTLSHNGQVGEFDFVTAHIMPSLFGFVNAQGGIFDTFQATPDYLPISDAQSLAAFFANYLNHDAPELSEGPEAVARLVAGLTGAILAVSNSWPLPVAGEFNLLVDTILDNFANAVNLTGTQQQAIAEALAPFQGKWELIVNLTPGAEFLLGVGHVASLVSAAVSDALDGNTGPSGSGPVSTAVQTILRHPG